MASAARYALVQCFRWGCAIYFSSVGGIACKIGYLIEPFYTSVPTNQWSNTVLAEKANGVFEDTLRHFVGPYQNNWGELLPVAEFAMNNA
jgi:hypothetical protein